MGDAKRPRAVFTFKTTGAVRSGAAAAFAERSGATVLIATQAIAKTVILRRSQLPIAFKNYLRQGVAVGVRY